MRTIKTNAELHHLEQRVLHHAKEFGRDLPEMRFYILDANEFSALLEKDVYPLSPVNIWEGRNMINRRFRINSGQESSLYYEVVQTGNPSYAYLNDTNNAMTQASVMAHVVGHCEFSQLNVLRDMNPDRTEFVMHLVRKVNMGRPQMGERDYLAYWNAVESASPLIAPNSQFNLDVAVQTESNAGSGGEQEIEGEQPVPCLMPYSSTLDSLLNRNTADSNELFQNEVRQKRRHETLSRKGFKLVAPCQDVLGFLRRHAPTSRAERAVLDYIYTVHTPHDFVVRTQIMNEGWAMYWEKKIKLELFREESVKGIIDYSKVFSSVCYPQPYFMRNPYHLGYHMWNHVEQLYRDGKVTLDYLEETDLQKKENWKRPDVTADPIEAMGHLVRTTTDYEFLRRFLTVDLVEEFHLNRIPRAMARQAGVKANDVVREDERWVWLNPYPIKDEMLNFFTHFHRPRIYLIDADFLEGGLLMYHRDDQRALRKEWIKPTMKNLNLIWKGPIYLLSCDTLYGYSANRFQEKSVKVPRFRRVVERMRESEKPFTL